MSIDDGPSGEGKNDTVKAYAANDLVPDAFIRRSDQGDIIVEFVRPSARHGNKARHRSRMIQTMRGGKGQRREGQGQLVCPRRDNATGVRWKRKQAKDDESDLI